MKIDALKTKIKYADYFTHVNWHEISMRKNLPMDFLELFKDKVDWFSVLVFSSVPEEYLEKFLSYVNCHWYFILKYQNLSEKFIERHLTLIRRQSGWFLFSKDIRNDEDYLEKHKYEVDWNDVIKKQKYLSLDFKAMHKVLIKSKLTDPQMIKKFEQDIDNY